MELEKIYEIKCILKPILKSSFLCVKHFNQSQQLCTKTIKASNFFQFSNAPPYRITVVFRFRRDFVERKIVDQLIYSEKREDLVDFAD